MQFNLKFRRGTQTQRRAVAFTGALGLGVAALAMVMSPANAVLSGSPSNFESNDGNMVVDTSGNADWASVKNLPAYFHLSDATNGTDDSFEPGSKQDDACPNVVGHSNPPKDDFTDVASFTDTNATTGAVYLYGATIRVAPNGSASENIELKQGSEGLCPGSTTLLKRSAGDKMIAIDYTNGGTHVDFHVLTWVTSGACYVANDPNPCWGATVQTLDANGAEGLVNQSDISAANNSFGTLSGAGILKTGRFAEFGVNLQAAGIIPAGTCKAFPQSIWESRSSGSSFVSSTKDISIENKTISNCAASLSTTPSNTTIALGSSIYDTATIALTGAGTPPAPTGTVSFFACGNAATTCTTGGTAVGSAVDLSTASHSGNNYSVNSGSFTPNAAGTWCFRAEWAGDTNYTAGPYVDGSTTECFTVTSTQPSGFTTQTGAPPTGLALGSAISDTLTLGNTAPQPDGDPAAGSVSFKLYGPQADPANPTCTAGNLVYTSPSYPVSGNGTYPTAAQIADVNLGAASYTPTAVGIYQWIATYTGDAPNTQGYVGGCADEPSKLFALQPSMGTAQKYYPNDSATITVASGAGSLTGTVVFKAYTNNTCTGTAAFTSSNIDVTTGPETTGLTETVRTNQTSFEISTDTSVWWKVTYVSTNSGIKNVTSNCTEHSSVTIVNGSASNSE